MNHFLSTYVKSTLFKAGDAVPALTADVCDKCNLPVRTTYSETRTPLCPDCYQIMVTALDELQAKGFHIG